MSWERGRAEIERLIADSELERVAPSDEVAARLIADAEAHVALAAKGVEDDPAGTLQLSYDAARKSSSTPRDTRAASDHTRRAHRGHRRSAVAVQRSWRHGCFRPASRTPRRRNRTEYPDLDSPGVTADDARQALDTRACHRRSIEATHRQRTTRNLRVAVSSS